MHYYFFNVEDTLSFNVYINRLKSLPKTMIILKAFEIEIPRNQAKTLLNFQQIRTRHYCDSLSRKFQALVAPGSLQQCCIFLESRLKLSTFNPFSYSLRVGTNPV